MNNTNNKHTKKIIINWNLRFLQSLLK